MVKSNTLLSAFFLMLAMPMASIAFSPMTAPAQPVVKTAPQYPDKAVELGLEGVVLLLLEIEESGEPASIKVKNQAHPVLRSAAIKTVRQWQFQPATRDGEAVRSTLKVPIRFELLSERPADTSVVNQVPFKLIN